VLVALSAGYWWGGRVADRDPTPNGLYRIVLLGAVLMGAVPFVADPFLEIAVDALDSIAAGAFAGSLFAVLVLVATPVLVLGMVAPYAIRLAVETVDEAGRTAGRLYAISTVGSLLGTFLSALLLIPLLGTRRTFLVFALALAIVAAAGLRRRVAIAAPLALAALIALPVGTVKASENGRVIHEAETEYQYARVVQDEQGDRRLELNEGHAIHSLKVRDSYLTGDYWDELLVGPFAARDTPPGRIAILGNAAGTTARAYGRYFPQTWVDGVEIDGEITDIGRKYFDMRGPRLETFSDDARPYLRRTKRRYDAILIDAYRQPYIPFYLATREFFQLAKDRLNPGGVVLVNVGHPERSSELEKVLSATIGDVFTTVLRDPVKPTNTVVIATDASGASAQRLARNAATLPPDLRPIAAGAAARTEAGLRGGKVYTDDKAPVEWLIDSSIVEVAAKGERAAP
jgi:spermidine synthase